MLSKDNMIFLLFIYINSVKTMIINTSLVEGQIHRKVEIDGLCLYNSSLNMRHYYYSIYNHTCNWVYSIFVYIIMSKLYFYSQIYDFGRIILGGSICILSL